MLEEGDDGTDQARLYCRLASAFMASGTFAGRMDITAFNSMKQQLGVDCNLIRFISKQIPYNCLNGKKKEAKRGTKMELCFGCSGVNELSKAFKCSRCKLASYCSKEYQIKIGSHAIRSGATKL